MEQKKELKKEIGLWGLSSNIINTMVGAGIFVLPAIVAEGLGAFGVVAYLICGLLIMLVMLCFAEVGSKITSTGGPYAYIEKSLGQYPGFIASIIFLLATLTADAAVANAISSLIGTFIPVFEHNTIRVIFFFLLFFGLGYVNVKGARGELD